MPPLSVILALGTTGDDAFERSVRPVLEARCFACHAGEDAEAGLDLELLAPGTEATRPLWSAVRRRVQRGEMPPEGETPLAVDDTAAILKWLDGRLGPEPEAGRSLRRLNRREYANAIRDLFGVAIEAEELPADEIGHGFDTVGAVQSMSELVVETHVRLAERVAERAVLLPDPPEPPRVRALGRELAAKTAFHARGPERVLHTNGTLRLQCKLPRAGEYAVRAGVYGQQAGPDPCRIALAFGERELARADVPEREPGQRVVETWARLPAGEGAVAISFRNDYWKPDEPDPRQRDRNLVVEWLEIEGPLDPPALSRWQREELAPGQPRALRAVVERLLRRVWRRPVDGDEVERVAAVARGAPTFEERVRAAIVAALSSPNFLFRIERAQPGLSHVPGDLLDDHSLAERLSYFLWSSTPDPELEAAADRGDLTTGPGLRGQVRRMIADPRSQALSEGFAVQWLQLGRLASATPDPERFPEWDGDLRASMLAEATMLFDSVLRERRPVRDLVDPSFTFVDERLARHYGIEGVSGSALRRVPLADGNRGGVLGMAAVLTATSYPTRTSPSSRGKYVLEALLGSPPPPPPPGVGVLDDAQHGNATASLRERLERHRTDAACASCHARIDPIGFGLENFDPLGRWRARDGRFEIDARGELPDGRSFTGPVELKRLVADDPAFVRCLTEKLATYALGRDLGAAIPSWLERIVREAGASPTLAQLVEEIAEDGAFRTR